MAELSDMFIEYLIPILLVIIFSIIAVIAFRYLKMRIEYGENMPDNFYDRLWKWK